MLGFGGLKLEGLPLHVYEDFWPGDTYHALKDLCPGVHTRPAYASHAIEAMQTYVTNRDDIDKSIARPLFSDT